MPPGNTGFRSPPSDRGARSGWLYPGSHPASQPPAPRRSTSASTRARGDYRHWARRAVRTETDEEAFNGALGRSSRTQGAHHFWEDRRVISAGVPWYASPFGRDALITGSRRAVIRTSRATLLLFLAAHQGGRWTTSGKKSLGKILHEIRRGELARTGEGAAHAVLTGASTPPRSSSSCTTEYLAGPTTAPPESRSCRRPRTRSAGSRTRATEDGDGFSSTCAGASAACATRDGRSWDGVPHLDAPRRSRPSRWSRFQG